MKTKEYAFISGVGTNSLLFTAFSYLIQGKGTEKFHLRAKGELLLLQKTIPP